MSAFPQSDAQIGVQFLDVGIEFVVQDLVDDLALLDDEMAVRDGRGEPEVLFDQNDGEALLLQPRDGLADLLDDDRARPSVGSSSSNVLAPVRRMRPIASICCSPPDSFVP